MQFQREHRIGPILVADRPDEPAHGPCSDAGEVAVGRRRIGSAVVHAVADLDSDGVAVENQTPHLALQHGDEVAVLGQVYPGAVNTGTERTFEFFSDGDEFRRTGAANKSGNGTEQLIKQGWVIQ